MYQTAAPCTRLTIRQGDRLGLDGVGVVPIG